MFGGIISGLAKQALGGLIGGGGFPTPPAQTDTPMPQQGNVINAQNTGSVENAENTLGGRASANARSRENYVASMPSGGNSEARRKANESRKLARQRYGAGVTPVKTEKQEKVEQAEGKSLKQWAIENAKSIGSDLATDLIRNKATDAIYGTKAEQDLAYMNTVYPNTDGYQRLGAGSGGALQATTAEKVARVNAKASKKVASIGQTTGAVARAQASKLRQEKETEEHRTREAKTNADWAGSRNYAQSRVGQSNIGFDAFGVKIGTQRKHSGVTPVN